MHDYPSDPPPHETLDEPRPRWLVLLGIAILVAIMATSAFATGVFLSERGLSLLR